MKASYLIKRINGLLSAQGKALPRVAEDILRKSPSELTEQESQWYRDNILPHESFFVETLKTLYSRERKPEKWLKGLGGGGPRSIVEEMAERALRELGVSVRPRVVEGPAILAGAAVPPFGAPPQWGAGAMRPENDGAVFAAEATPTSSPAIIVRPAPEGPSPFNQARLADAGEMAPGAEVEPSGAVEVCQRGAVRPEGEGPKVSASPPTVIVPGALAEPTPFTESGTADAGVVPAGQEGEAVKGTFHLREEEPDYREREEAGGEAVRKGEGSPGEAFLPVETGEAVESAEGTPTVYLPEGPPLIDYRQTWEQTAESPPSPIVVDHRYELERGPEVPLYQEMEVALPEMLPPVAVPPGRRGIRAWISEHKVLASSVVAALVLLGAGLFMLFFFFLGGEKILDEWSASQSLGKNVRVERQVCLKKNAGGSPFLYVVTLKLENTGGEEIKRLQVEEEVPQLLWAKGGIRYTPEPERSSEETRRVGWTGEHIASGEFFLIEYSLPLQAELSAPQLEEIEEHFSKNIIACVYLPENFETCKACNGQGSTTCQACAGMGSVACPTCRAVGYVTCSACRGQGKVTCPECDGYGYFYYFWWGTYVCSYCGGTGKVACRNCGGTGRVTCPTCRGSMRISCASCGGTGKITCSTCGGDGLVPVEYGERVLYKEGS